MSKKFDTIYLDWDGVIWDFKQAFCDWMGVQVPKAKKWEFYLDMKMTHQEFQRVLSELPQEFWQQEGYIMPHAFKLVEWARANAEDVFVLTLAPEWSAAQGKQNLSRKHFDLGVYTVAKAEEKVEFVKDGAILIDDKPSTVVRFANETTFSGGYVWPADYNDGLSPCWYFKLSWLEKSDRLAGTIHDINLHDYSVKIEKPVLDYDAMDGAKKRKMTPMYSGLLAYFPDALAVVAQNSMVGHYQHNDPSDPMYWDREKSADDADGMVRHLADHSKNPYDTDGRLHLGKVAWRALAMLQKFIEEEQNEQG